MKIEIEYEEVESLKNRIIYLENNKRELEGKIVETDIANMEKRAINLSFNLAAKYIKEIFNKMGFTNHGFSEYSDSHRMFDQIDHWVGKEWYKTDRFDIRLSVHHYNNMKEAVLNIITKSKEDLESRDNLLNREL